MSVSNGKYRSLKVPPSYTTINMQALADKEYCIPQLSIAVKKLYILLIGNEALTSSEIADALGVNKTETYYLLRAMQDKKLVKALPKTPVRFTAIPNANLVRNATFQRVFNKSLQYCYTTGSTQVWLNIDQLVSKLLDEVSFLQAQLINLEERIDKVENDSLQERACKMCGIELNVENACKETLGADICNECWINFNIR